MSNVSKVSASLLTELLSNSNAPKSVLSIPFLARDHPISKPVETINAVIRPVGTCRSVYLFNSHLNSEEMEGLAHHLKILSRNQGLNSVLISFGKKEMLTESGGYIVPRSSYMNTQESITDFSDFDPDPDSEFKFDGCSYPLPQEDDVSSALDNLTNLGFCTHNADTKIPIIFFAQGTISDGGYALSLCSHYTLCSSQTYYQILNPLKGLSFDPIGLSFVFNRLGIDFQQRTAQSLSFPIGRLVSLGGYEMDGWDMMSTGMGTHMIDGPVDECDAADLLEYHLSNLISYQEQNLIPRSVRTMGEVEKLKRRKKDLDQEDILNRKYKNVIVDNFLRDFCSAKAGHDEWMYFASKAKKVWEETTDVFNEDVLWEGVGSELLDITDAFEDILKPDNDLEDVVEGMKEVLSQEDAQKEVKNVAKEFLDEVEQRSPLALLAVDKLLNMGMGAKETLQSCVEREKKVMMNLMEKDDYKNWVAGKGQKIEWKHKSIEEVSNDEVEELFGE